MIASSEANRLYGRTSGARADARLDSGFGAARRKSLGKPQHYERGTESNEAD